MAGKKATIYFLLLVVLSLAGMIFYQNYYPILSKVDVVMKKSNEIGLNDSIVVNFSLPMKIDGYAKGIRLEPSVRATVEWQEKNRKMVITPMDGWKMETQYKIILPQGKSILFSKTESQNLNFATPSYPKVTRFFPAREAREVVLGMEDPMVVDFNESISNFSLKVSLNPETEIIYQNSEDGNQLKILPKNQLLTGQKYEVKILAKVESEAESNFQEIYQSSFETLPPTPQNWEKDFSLRLEQAKKYTKPKVATGRYIDINLISQVMSIFEEGKVVDAFMVSTGKRGMDTQKGEYTIHNKSPRVWSKKYGLWMPFWMAVAPDGSFGIHELPEWPSGYKEGASHLGTPVSHGCIRLGVGPAKFVYDFTEVGMPVVIY